jgi:hypothetical protein
MGRRDAASKARRPLLWVLTDQRRPLLWVLTDQRRPLPWVLTDQRRPLLWMLTDPSRRLPARRPGAAPSRRSPPPSDLAQLPPADHIAIGPGAAPSSRSPPPSDLAQLPPRRSPPPGGGHGQPRGVLPSPRGVLPSPRGVLPSPRGGMTRHDPTRWRDRREGAGTRSEAPRGKAETGRLSPSGAGHAPGASTPRSERLVPTHPRC